MRIRPMVDDDAAAVLAVYAEGIAAGTATFETAAPTWQAWDGGHLDSHRLVALADDGGVVGWVAASPVSGRCVYAGVVELSVYVAAAGRGRGVGGALLAAMIDSSEAAGVWTLEAGVFTDNAASLALLGRHGFRRVGVRERLGQRGGVWQDLVLLERRSALV
ncbi:N-acetyltransferase family protein [Pengzhenrongella frigida]